MAFCTHSNEAPSNLCSAEMHVTGEEVTSSAGQPFPKVLLTYEFSVNPWLQIMQHFQEAPMS